MLKTPSPESCGHKPRTGSFVDLWRGSYSLCNSALSLASRPPTYLWWSLNGNYPNNNIYLHLWDDADVLDTKFVIGTHEA